MSDLSIAAPTEKHHHYSACNPIPSAALYILIPLFILGFSVSIFVLVVVHNAFFFLSLLLLSIFLSAFALWNNLSFSSKAAILSFLHSFPDSDLTLAREGQLVKITGVFLLFNPISFFFFFFFLPLISLPFSVSWVIFVSTLYLL